MTASLDGSSVAFTRSRWGGEDAKPSAGGYAHLWRVPYAGGAPKRLTYADAAIRSPRFSPDGTAIAFLAERGGETRGEEETRSRVVVLPIAGGESRALTGEEPDVKGFAWSPDGKTVAWLGGGFRNSCMRPCGVVVAAPMTRGERRSRSTLRPTKWITPTLLEARSARQ